MSDDPSKNADGRTKWIKRKIDFSFGKVGDKKFEKAFYSEENAAKVCGLSI